MLRFLLSAASALFLTSTVHADEVRDVLLLQGEQHVWIALDGAPTGLSAYPGQGHLLIALTGFSPSSAREIRTRDGGPLEAVSIRPGGQIVLSGGFASAAAELRDGGVLVSFGDAPAYRAEAAPAQDSRQIGAPQLRAAAPETTEPARSPAAPSRLARTEPQEAAPTQTPAAVQSAVAEGETGSDAPAPAGLCEESAAVIASSPWDLDALARHAACLAENGEGRNAAGLYERVLAFEPGHFQAALGLARLREAEGRRADAARLFEAAANSALTDGEALAARQAAARLRGDDS
jgi:tetratricopeptide (TPR) repeat protein